MEPAKPMSQKEYLKRYLMKDKKSKVKKKKPNISSSTHLKRSVIIDDDINISEIPQVIDDHFSLDHLGDEAPQIAGIVDERPETVKLEEKFKSGEWRPMGEEERLKPPQGRKKASNLTEVNYSSPPWRKDLESDKGIRYERMEERQKSDDSDLSPPRPKRSKEDERKDNKHRSEDKRKSISRGKSIERDRLLSSRERKSSSSEDSDLSPPRPNRRKDESDKNYQKHKSGERKSSKSARPENRQNSRKGRRSEDEDSDLSPPRSNRNARESKRQDRSRNSEDRQSSKSKSGSLRREGKDRSRAALPSSGSGDSDLEVNRKSSASYRDRSNKNKKRSDNDSDLSPPRRGRPPSSDNREKRKKDISYSDLSPRRRRAGDDSSPAVKTKNGRGKDGKLVEKSDQMQDGKRAGLQDAKSLKQELKNLKEREDEMFRKMDPEIMGRSTTAIVRDRRTGLKRDLEKEREVEREKAAKNAVRQQKYDRWGKGLKQVRDQEERVLDMMHEMSKPLARYAGDDDLERALKAQEREGDPMLDYIKRHQKESHTVDLTVGGVRKKYMGSFLPNRFNVAPGHRWDGVDRSNGYEQKWFEARNSSKATAEEAWKWSSADM